MSFEGGALLIVDDNEMNREVLQRRLARQGYDITTASSGKEALDLIAKRRFDLALFDIMMPEISGLEALAIVRETYSLADLPVIMVTAKTQSEDIVEALKLGANDYVTKPIDFPVLLARVQTHLRLRRLSELKDEFMRMASHDLRNPLTEVLGVSSLVEALVPPGTVMTEEMHGLITAMKKGARRMQHIIEDFLDFRVLEDGQIRLETTDADLGQMARDVVAANRTTATNKDITLTVEAAANLPPVPLDARRIGQVLQNLVDNAIKFSPKGSAIEVGVAPDGDDVRVSVRDHGPGLTEADFGKAFRKYASLSSKPTAGEKSTGLGLAICKQLVERHVGGRLGVENHPGGGAVFWIALPTVPLSLAAAPERLDG